MRSQMRARAKHFGLQKPRTTVVGHAAAEDDSQALPARAGANESAAAGSREEPIVIPSDVKEEPDECVHTELDC